MRTTSRQKNGTGRFAGLVFLASAMVVFAGCHDRYKTVVVDPGCDPVGPPVGLYSITGDEEVILYWTPVNEHLVDDFIVYRSSSPDGYFYEIGHSHGDWFVDDEVTNGRTYYYAVSAVDHCGYESELSYEIAYDTPRPEGFDEVLYDANGMDWRRSGWDFSSYRSVSWDATSADIFFLWADDLPFLVAADLDTDIQDAGYADFDDVTWAPSRGWSPSGTVEVIPGHVYVVWTRDNHFAKVRAREISGNYMVFDWAYQIDTGNPELAPRPGREPSPLTVNPGSRSLSASKGADLMNTRIAAEREES